MRATGEIASSTKDGQGRCPWIPRVQRLQQFKELTTSNKNFKPPSTWAKRTNSNRIRNDSFFINRNGNAEPNGTSIPGIGPDATLIRHWARQGSKSRAWRCFDWLLTPWTLKDAKNHQWDSHFWLELSNCWNGWRMGPGWFPCWKCSSVTWLAPMVRSKWTALRFKWPRSKWERS